MDIRNSEKAYIYRRDKKKCFYCEEKLKYRQITLDHYLPKSRGGTEVIYNLVLCCEDCNRLKGNKTPSNYKELIIRLFKKAVLDGMIKGENLKISSRELQKELLKVNKIEDIRDIFVFQSNTMRFYIDKNKVIKIIHLG